MFYSIDAEPFVLFPQRNIFFTVFPAKIQKNIEPIKRLVDYILKLGILTFASFR